MNDTLTAITEHDALDPNVYELSEPPHMTPADYEHLAAVSRVLRRDKLAYLRGPERIDP